MNAIKLGAVAVLVIASQPAQAADIYLRGMAWTGIPAIFIRGLIEYGDEEKFAAVAALHRASVVNMQTPGGNIPAAIAIGRMVREHKLDTFLGRGGQCSSA